MTLFYSKRYYLRIKILNFLCPANNKMTNITLDFIPFQVIFQLYNVLLHMTQNFH